MTEIEREMVWMTAGRPAPGSTVIDVRFPAYEFPIRAWGTLAVNDGLCNASSVRVPLSRSGLVARGVGVFDERFDCSSPRIFVRVRAVLESRASLRSFRGFLRTAVPVKQATLVVQTASKKPLVHAQVFGSGASLLSTAPSCVPD